MIAALFFWPPALVRVTIEKAIGSPESWNVRNPELFGSKVAA